MGEAAAPTQIDREFAEICVLRAGETESGYTKMRSNLAQTMLHLLG